MADSSICTLTGNGDVFGVELRSDGRTPSLTPLPPSTHVCVPSSMKVLISLTRSFGESAHLASSHGVTSNNDNKCWACSQGSSIQEGSLEDILGRSLRRESSSWARSSGPSHGGSTLHGAPPTSSSRQLVERKQWFGWLARGAGWGCHTHPSIRSPCNDSQPGTIASRYIQGGGRVGSGSSLPPRDDRQDHCLQCGRVQPDGAIGPCSSTEGSNQCKPGQQQLPVARKSTIPGRYQKNRRWAWLEPRKHQSEPSCQQRRKSNSLGACMPSTPAPTPWGMVSRRWC